MIVQFKDGVFIALSPTVSGEVLQKREQEAAERAIIFNAKIKAEMEEGKLPEVVIRYSCMNLKRRKRDGECTNKNV